MTLEGLSGVCAKLDPASSKNNEILEINVLQKFTSHALFNEAVNTHCSGDNKEKLSTGIGIEYASDFCHDRKSASIPHTFSNTAHSLKKLTIKITKNQLF